MSTPIVQLYARLPADVHEALKRAAARDHRSLNGELVTALKEWLQQNGYLAKDEKPKAGRKA